MSHTKFSMISEKTLTIQLQESEKKISVCNQRIQNQKKELKKFNEKRNEINKLKKMLTAEKQKRISTVDVRQYQKKITDLQANLRTEIERDYFRIWKNRDSLRT